MSADFWAGYVSGAAGILIGNPLDIVKVQLQRAPASTTEAASPSSLSTSPFRLPDLFTLQAVKGTAAPILGYGALNALLFMTYNRSMSLMSQDPSLPSSLSKTFMSGALAGFATFVVSAPTELVKCRAQVGHQSSWEIARQVWREGGLRGLYFGGAITSVRDSVGYGFYFWSYELSKRALIGTAKTTEQPEWMSVLLCGGIAGVVTWASIFPLDVVKTRLQTQGIESHPPIINSPTSPSFVGNAPVSAGQNEQSSLLRPTPSSRLNSLQIAQQAYHNEGLAVFFRGFGICSVRAFFVNAVQWAVYEWMMHTLLQPSSKQAS